MAEATVTLKLSPQEFDLIRDALGTAHDRTLVEGSPSFTPDASERSKLRAKALLIADLGKKLGA